MVGSALYDVAALLRPCDLLLVVPPFAWLDRPALGVHLLQALARRAGLEAQVLYANALFAARFGEATSVTLANLQYGWFLGDRLFARAAFGGAPLGRDGGDALVAPIETVARSYRRRGRAFHLGLPRLLTLEAEIPGWLDSFVPQIAAAGYAIVGATTSFEQTAASLAILQGVKARAPATVTLLGGANCEGEMAHGIRSLSTAIDHVFSGESEASFAAWLAARRRGEPQPPLIEGAPCDRLDSPTPDYGDYFTQLAALVPDGASARDAAITYETSRGCWWGQKRHCTFCGLNGLGMKSRAKSPARVFEELGALVAAHPGRRVTMTDNIMPHDYFQTVVPRLAAEVPGVRLMYEQKANLSLRQVIALMGAGIDEIQPGIEALATELLALMAKGTTVAQNLALLRYARTTGMRLQWSLLYGLPGDDVRSYEQTLALVPLLHHLPPPHGVNRVVIDRFSPYHDRPDYHGIRELRPLAGYQTWLPPRADVARLAYRFEATFAAGSLDRPEVIVALTEAVAGWREAYHGADGRPRLEVARDGDDYLLVDTRGLPGLPASERIDRAQALVALVRQRPRAGDDVQAWARDRRVAVERDHRLVPLAVASADLLLELEAVRPLAEPLALAP